MLRIIAYLKSPSSQNSLRDINVYKMIFVDINVANLQIRALKPMLQYPMLNRDAEKILFFNTIEDDRLNKRTYGTLKGKH